MLVTGVLRLFCPSCLRLPAVPATTESANPEASALPANKLPRGLSLPIDSPDLTQAAQLPQLRGALSASVPWVEELNSLLALSSAEASELRKSKVRDWAEADPSAAAAWAAAVKDASARADALEQVAISWANTDLQAAARWISSLPEDKGKETVAVAFAYESARTDPLTALQIAGSIPDSLARDEAITHAVSQWAATDSASALLWARQVTDVQLQQQLFSAISVAASDTTPVTGARMSAALLDPGSPQENAAVSVVQRWAQTSPQAAADWIVQFPEGSGRSAAVDNLVAIWALKDVSAAQSWVESLPEGALRDTAVSAWTHAVASLGGSPN